jgi:HdeA/HdeB family
MRTRAVRPLKMRDEMKKLLIAFGVTMLGVLLVYSAAANSQQGYNREGQVDLKKFSCREYVALVEAEDGRADVATVWAHGYHSALDGLDPDQAVTGKMVEAYGKRLEETCRAQPDSLFLSTIKATK